MKKILSLIMAVLMIMSLAAIMILSLAAIAPAADTSSGGGGGGGGGSPSPPTGGGGSPAPVEPDLIVNPIVVEQDGKEVDVNVVIKNIGSKDLTDWKGRLFFFELNFDGGEKKAGMSSDYLQLQSLTLPKGGTLTFTIPFAVPTENGILNVYVKADSHNEVTELNEDNNERSYEVTLPVKEGRPVPPPEVVPPKRLLPPCESYGDVNLDGFVTEEDAKTVANYLVGNVKLIPSAKERADVNGDATVSIADALLIAQYTVGRITTFPVCSGRGVAPPGTVITWLDQKFTLEKGQDATVIDYRNMNVKLTGIETKVCVAVVGKECPSPVATIEVSFSQPIHVLDTSTSVTYVTPSTQVSGGGGSPVSCTDSDGGEDYYVKGTTTGPDSYGSNITNIASYTDKCDGTERVMEFYCLSINYPTPYVTMNNAPCPSGCNDGACVPSSGVITPIPTPTIPRVEPPITGKLIQLSKGESETAFGATITALDVTSSKATFVVSKQVYASDVVDIGITPRVVNIVEGGVAEYTITVEDKHAVFECPPDAACKPTAPYNYNIQVIGLPLGTSYEKTVLVGAGQKEEIALTVSTSKLVEEPAPSLEKKRFKTQPVGKPIPISSITSQSAPLTSADVARKCAFSGQDYETCVLDEEKGRTTSVAGISQAQAETATSEEEKPAEIATSATSASGGAATGASNAQKASKPESMPSRQPYQNYRFAVRVTGENAVDVVYATLNVLQRDGTLPPIVVQPVKKVSISLERGWNLVSLPGTVLAFLPSDCTANKKMLGFVYLEEQGKYVSLQAARKQLGDGFSDYLSKHAFWVYSYNDECTFEANVKAYASYGELSLAPGWNLIPVMESMVGKNLNELNVNCDFKKLYKWAAEKQEWSALAQDYEFGKVDLNKGFIAKTGNYCEFGGELTIAPPEFPE